MRYYLSQGLRRYKLFEYSFSISFTTTAPQQGKKGTENMQKASCLISHQKLPNLG